jgi:hypothetical protein
MVSREGNVEGYDMEGRFVSFSDMMLADSRVQSCAVMCHRADLLRFYLVIQVGRKERREGDLPTYVWTEDRIPGFRSCALSFIIY